MVNDPTTGVFGHRNARSKTPEQVAEGFVAPPQYWEIAQPGNTVLIGPRGSGKTTLLKMLQGPGLERWQDPQANRARSLITYSGVLIPADRSWAGQVDTYGRWIEDSEVRRAVGRACFTLHVLRALSKCAAERVRKPRGVVRHDRAELERAQEEQVVGHTWRTWALEEPVGSFAGLASALSTLLAEIGNLARRSLRRPEAIEELSAHRAMDLDIIDATVPFIERFNDAAGQEDHVWAFLIDELEFLPQGVHRFIHTSMRGRDPRILQKLSLAPYTLGSDVVAGPLEGWEGHDLETVDLTFSEKEDGYAFSRALIEKEVADQAMSAEDLLGEPGFFEMPAGRDAYRNGSRNAEAIKSLAAKDPSFADWLKKHAIDAENPAQTVGERRASTLRKAIPIVLLRNEYLHEIRSQLSPRTRKAPRTYVGELSAYAVCENNPRLLQTMVSRLMARAKEGVISDTSRVEVIGKISEEYHLHLRALEVPETAPFELLPQRLIDLIGEHFQKGVMGEKFDPEPALSFEISRDALEGSVMQPILYQLIHYGAVVQVEPERFRLAHTFAPIYVLPLRKGRSHALRSILADKAKLMDQLVVGWQEGMK